MINQRSSKINSLVKKFNNSILLETKLNIHFLNLILLLLLLYKTQKLFIILYNYFDFEASHIN